MAATDCLLDGRIIRGHVRGLFALLFRQGCPLDRGKRRTGKKGIDRARFVLLRHETGAQDVPVMHQLGLFFKPPTVPMLRGFSRRQKYGSPREYVPVARAPRTMAAAPIPRALKLPSEL